MSVKKTTVRLLVAGVLACLVPVTFDCLYVHGPRGVVSALSDVRVWKPIWVTAAMVALVGFFIALLDHFGDQRQRARVVQSAIVSAVILPFWFLVASLVVLAFHILIGGKE
jgi:hypothetical protein